MRWRHIVDPSCRSSAGRPARLNDPPERLRQGRGLSTRQARRAVSRSTPANHRGGRGRQTRSASVWMRACGRRMPTPPALDEAQARRLRLGSRSLTGCIAEVSAQAALECSVSSFATACGGARRALANAQEHVCGPAAISKRSVPSVCRPLRIARRCTSRTVVAIRSRRARASQPPAMNWNGRTGWPAGIWSTACSRAGIGTS
jgi:hypothetical protein